MGSIVAALAVAATAAAGFGIAWLLPLSRLTDRVVAGAVCCSALVVGGSLLLSIPGAWFTRPALLALAGLEVAGVAALWAFSPAARARAQSDLRRALTGATALPRAGARHPLVSLLCASAALLVGWRTLVGLVIGVRDYDGLWYHLVTAQAFVHDHRVGVRVPVNIYSDSYTANLEVHAAWLMLLSGSAGFAAVTQVPFALLGAAVTSAVGRRLGLASAPAVGAGALFLLTPVVLDQLSQFYNDVAVSALLLAGLHFAAVAVTDRTLRPPETVATVTLAGAALGLATGGKASAGPASALALLVLLVALARQVRRRRLPARLAVAAVAAGLAAVLCLGGAYYVRDLAVFGNPLQPFTVSFGPVTFRGPLTVPRDLVSPFLPSWAAGLPGPLVVAQVWAGLRDPEHGTQIPRYLGWQWFALWPCLAAVLVGAVRRWRRHGHFLMVAGTCLAAVALQPVAWWGRYVIYVVAPAAVAFFAVERALRRRGPGWSLVGRAAFLLLVAVVLWPLPSRLSSARAGIPDTSFGAGTARTVPAREVLAGLVGGPGSTVWDEPQFGWARAAPAGSRILVTQRSPYFLGPLPGPSSTNTLVFVRRPIRPGALPAVMAARRLRYAYLSARDPLATYALAHPKLFRRVGQGGGSVTFRLADRRTG